MDPKVIEQIGTTGVVVLGLFYLVRTLVVWMQQRIDSRDVELDKRHSELAELTRSTIEFINDSKLVNKAMIDEMQKMGREICRRLDGIEGKA